MSVRGSKLIERVEECCCGWGKDIPQTDDLSPLLGSLEDPLRQGRLPRIRTFLQEIVAHEAPACHSLLCGLPSEREQLGYLCKMHATQLSRLVRSKDTKVSDSQEIIEEATWPSVPESQEEQEEVLSVTRKEANITTKPAGRPD